MSKTLTKSAIDAIETNVNSTHLVQQETVINTTRDALLLQLNPSNNFFVNEENKNKIIKISNDLITKKTYLQQQEATLTNRETELIDELTRIVGVTTPQANNKRLTIATEQATIAAQLARITTMLGHINTIRQTEYEALANTVNTFDLTRQLPEMKNNTYNCGADFMSPGETADSFDYYNEAGTPINRANYWIDIKLKDGKIENVKINGLTAITIPNGTIDLTGITFTDRSGNPYIPTQGYEFMLNLGATKTLGGRNLISTKELKVLRGTATTLDTTAQRARYETFNTLGAPINEYIQDFYKNNYKETEDKILHEMIGDTISDEQKKKVLIKRIKSLTDTRGRAVSPCIINQREINNGFREDFFANIKPTAEDISNPTRYNDFLRKKMPEHLKTYLEKEIKRQMESTTTVAAGTSGLYLPKTRKLHDIITNEILTYKQEQEEYAQDNFSDAGSLSANTKINEKLRSPELKRDGLFSKKDLSYMKYFANQSEETGKQTLSLQTDKDKNKVEFTGYNAKINIGNVDHMSVDIHLDNGEDFSLKAGNHVKLIKSILNEPRIQYGKMRMHIAYNIMKAMIKIANKNNITIEYADGKIINRISIDKNNDLVLEKIDDTTGIRDKKKLFSESEFNTENDMHQLRGGLENCLEYFNQGMRKMHKQYRKSNDKKIFSYFNVSRAKFPTSRIGSPIKKLMNIRKNRTLNFDFPSTKVEGISNDVSISFSKNKYTITSDLLPKPITSRNLEKLLNTRIKGKRVFDGIQLAIGGTAYKNIISKLRENSKIANTNFGVKDTVKNRVYFMDKAGEIGYISLANNDNPISKKLTRRFKNNYGTIKELPTTGRVILSKKEEQNEFYQNPFLIGKIMKAINTRLYSF